MVHKILAWILVVVLTPPAFLTGRVSSLVEQTDSAPIPQQSESCFTLVGSALVDVFSISTAQATDISKTYAKGNGAFVVRPGVVTSTSGSVLIQAEGNSQTPPLAAGPGGEPLRASSATATTDGSYALSLTVHDGPDFVSGASSVASLEATLTKNGVPEPFPAPLTWTVESSSITQAWWSNRSSGAMNGLAWGQTAISLNEKEAERTDMSGNGGTAPTGATACLTDIVGSRTVVVKASLVIGGTTCSRTATVKFGNGPLSVFGAAPTSSDSMNWTDAVARCGGTGNLHVSDYQPDTKLPMAAQLQAVAGSGSDGNQGAAHAAAWPDDSHGIGWIYWTGEANGSGGIVRVVTLIDGFSLFWVNAIHDYPIAVCLP